MAPGDESSKTIGLDYPASDVVRHSITWVMAAPRSELTMTSSSYEDMPPPRPVSKYRNREKANIGGVGKLKRELKEKLKREYVHTYVRH